MRYLSIILSLAGGLSMPIKLAAIGGLIVAAWGAWELQQYQQRQIGAKAALEQAKKDTNDAIKKNADAAAAADLSFSACFDAGRVYDFENDKCGTKKASE